MSRTRQRSSLPQVRLRSKGILPSITARQTLLCSTDVGALLSSKVRSESYPVSSQKLPRPRNAVRAEPPLKTLEKAFPCSHPSPPPRPCRPLIVVVRGVGQKCRGLEANEREPLNCANWWRRVAEQPQATTSLRVRPANFQRMPVVRWKLHVSDLRENCTIGSPRLVFHENGLYLVIWAFKRPKK